MTAPTEPATFPLPLDHYPAPSDASILEVLDTHLEVVPFNGVATPSFCSRSFIPSSPISLRRRRARWPSCSILGEVEAIIGRLSEVPLFFRVALLTAFNDNALIAYLATLVPNLYERLRYAVVAGAVAGGGLTVIANAPNPAGQALLGKYFDGGNAPLGLLADAVAPTLVATTVFLLL
jgi:hypothetical protein